MIPTSLPSIALGWIDGKANARDRGVRTKPGENITDTYQVRWKYFIFIKSAGMQCKHGKNISYEASQLEMSLMVMIASLQVLALVAICTYIQLIITIQVLYEVTGSGVYQDFNYDIPNGNRWQRNAVLAPLGEKISHVNFSQRWGGPLNSAIFCGQKQEGGILQYSIRQLPFRIRIQVKVKTTKLWQIIWNRLRRRSCDYQGSGPYNQACVFPFRYQGNTYTECTTVQVSQLSLLILLVCQMFESSGGQALVFNLDG